MRPTLLALNANCEHYNYYKPRGRARALMTVPMFTAAFSAINTFGKMKKYNAPRQLRDDDETRFPIEARTKVGYFSRRTFFFRPPAKYWNHRIGQIGKIFVTRKRFVSKADANTRVNSNVIFELHWGRSNSQSNRMNSGSFLIQVTVGSAGDFYGPISTECLRYT